MWDRVVAFQAAARGVRAGAVCVVTLLAAALPGHAAPAPGGGKPPGVTSGIVVDATGGAISGAAITLKTSSIERKTVSNRQGAFRFDDAPAGLAILTVAFDRFATSTVDLEGPRGNLRIVLQPLVTETVTVQAPAVTALRTSSATRTDTLLRDVPQSVSVVTSQLIADQTMQSLADVVRYTPGVGMAQGEGHRDAAIFRGNTSTADFFVDGLRDDTQYLRDLYNVERVEVLKGPNGMVFGRGGVGGVINRVTRQADWTPSREITVHGGSWAHRRASADLGHAPNEKVAVRLSGMYENSGSYRDEVELERYGLNPTVAFSVGSRTILRAGYEIFRDERTTDRGVPSLNGRPLDVDPSVFFGSPDLNTSRVTVNSLSAGLEHDFNGALRLRSQVRFADYDKFYQNLVPGALSADRTTVPLTGYNSGTQRQNLFSQTDLFLSRRTGALEHTLVGGFELGRQVTDNRRLTAFFPVVSPTTTTVRVPLASPVTSQPAEFRAAGSDADNHGVATVAALYVQDHVSLSPRWQAIVGLRFDRFTVDLRDNRTGGEFTSEDGLVSPRLALVFKPVVPVSIYVSYARAHLPRAGEQLSSLTPSNQSLDPESFRNYELGAKWEITRSLSVAAAAYRLDHGNVVVRDAVDPTVSHLVDAERTKGLELEVSGSLTERWSVQGGYAYQDGEITRSLSTAVVAGARLAQVPRHSFSLWNKYDISTRWGVGLGIVSRGDGFVATDNQVVLPGFTRVDAAVFANLTARLRAHLNLENLFDERYYWSAHNNNNIAPGSPRGVRVTLTTRF